MPLRFGIKQMKLAAIAILLSVASAEAAGPVVVTGATGRTGSIVFNLLQSRSVQVRALVRNATKAREILGCVKCDESEGIYVGDITVPASLQDVMSGASALAIATSARPIVTKDGISFPKGAEPVDIDWNGAKNQLIAFAESSGASTNGPVVLISTMGTETPEDPKDQHFMDYISFYKLNFEAELMSSGLPFTIIKPCGLDYTGTEPGKKELVTGHDDEDINVNPPSIPRADVARVVVAAIEQPDVSAGLRFDLCAKEGTPTPEAALGHLLESAKYPWERKHNYAV